MATGARPSPSSPPSQLESSSPPLQPISWEGDRMFNIYIYDYCYKRGFLKTARELLLEAEIGVAPFPPINARKSLLFEWWSIFWLIFVARTSGTGPEETLPYTQDAQGKMLAARGEMQQRFQTAPARQPCVMPNCQLPNSVCATTTTGSSPSAGSTGPTSSTTGPEPNTMPDPPGVQADFGPPSTQRPPSSPPRPENSNSATTRSAQSTAISIARDRSSPEYCQ